MSVRTVADVQIELGGVVASHEVQVCDDLAQDMLIIIGTDFLRPYQFLIDFAKETIEANGRTSNLIMKPITIPPHSAESITIPPHSMANIACKVERGTVVDDMTGVLEPELRFVERYSIGIIKVVATVKNGCIPVRIFNFQANPRRIYRGSTMGNLFPLTEAEDESPWYTCVKTIHPHSSTELKNTCMAARKGDLNDVRK